MSTRIFTKSRKSCSLLFAVEHRIYNGPIYRAQIPAKLAFTAGVSIPSSERTTTGTVAHAPQFGLQKNHGMYYLTC